MKTSSLPFAAVEPADVLRYRHLRSLSRELNHRMIKTLPRKALDDIGEALGLLRRGVLVFDTEDASSVFMDCCLYDWLEDGKNVVKKYAESHASTPGTDEDTLLRAFQRARYRVVVPQTWLPGAGVHVEDVLSGERFFLMDINLSRNSPDGPPALATRTIPLEGYWTTGGAPLVMDREAAALATDRLAKAKILAGDSISDPHRFALIVVRACLESGAAERVRFQDPADPDADRDPGGRRPLRVSPVPGRNEPCLCGSKKKYKTCCGSARR